ncbi:rRNA pseudouridine synthase [Candidatus Peregrinibacteria bacterium]|nr:rRNA pseudouridine synthase [Candidatus Peregrinibacteria bacterium]
MSLLRLNKYLAEHGIASRREADVLIKAGKVKVNGRFVTQLGVKVDPEKDLIKFDGKPVSPKEKPVYIVLNKPSGFVCSSKKTELDPKIALDLIDVKERIYSIGRLDKETTGLILFTNDGELANRLTHPSFEGEKEYEVIFYEPIKDSVIRRLEKGVPLKGEPTLPMKIKRLAAGRVRITLREGRNRQIRRLCQKVGCPVKALKRVRIKKLTLGPLRAGEWRYLTLEEIRMLKSA